MKKVIVGLFIGVIGFVVVYYMLPDQTKGVVDKETMAEFIARTDGPRLMKHVYELNHIGYPSCADIVEEEFSTVANLQGVHVTLRTRTSCENSPWQHFVDHHGDGKVDYVDWTPIADVSALDAERSQRYYRQALLSALDGLRRGVAYEPR